MQVRGATVRIVTPTSKSLCINRPVNKLCPLEVPDRLDKLHVVKTDQESNVVQRKRRAAALDADFLRRLKCWRFTTELRIFTTVCTLYFLYFVVNPDWSWTFIICRIHRITWILSLTIWFNVYIDQRTLSCLMVGRKKKKRKKMYPFKIVP